ncbi:bifunctional phosphoribosylaminoimidazolecarboxamide formyltransferase/IMP cyclohydrolase [Legionella oakridgensis]|uniref:bifunctional phosphoribosylaminoimidazolecarboxamide formyltransferase/IMP cyclohydrolase n=1 Tax=Legionella oakridgensis TaxID=29423 RepID=UPI0003DE34EB|nr:bifunctional phosphoribosylaminoimidazolecarboxamide formyltransferase/IMP cyclohydrolase [Legionella oakridgensis]ETO93641.1 IMP cyclohydrolase/phosphoribosylaminoimidazolecarboxamide formyltransferase [Legionella oakridgensis RV-2-2007]
MTTSFFNPRRALISVSDKRDLVLLATKLHQQNIELVATGKTATLLQDHGFPITKVEHYTGFPELLDGRVKTLHPAIHAGLLADGTDDEKSLRPFAIRPFDLLIVNLYPFEDIISRAECTLQDALDHIDIGGPAMIRAAAKNHANIAVVVTPDDYPKLIQYVEAKQMPEHWTFTLAKKAFAHTARYDAMITNYLNCFNREEQKSAIFPDNLISQHIKQNDLRYGENPHQQAALYVNIPPMINSLAQALCLQGKPLSYNNLLDADAAWNCLKSFSDYEQVCVIVKHGNPCGIAARKTQVEAYERAYESDSVSSYGGILAFNRCLQADTVKTMLARQFIEVIIAPDISKEAQVVLTQKENIRVLITGNPKPWVSPQLDVRSIDGGLLIQERDEWPMHAKQLKTVTTRKPNPQQLQDLLFAWRAVKHVKSNAIVFAKEEATIGIGAGQTSRIMSTRIGLWQAESAGFSTHQAVMASDAFIPFADSINMAAQYGITAVIQPGGSIRDEEIIEAANTLGIVMIFTGHRHFRH